MRSAFRDAVGAAEGERDGVLAAGMGGAGTM